MKRIPKKWLVPLLLLGGYVLIFVINHFGNEVSECITNDWCISSKEDKFLYPLLPLVSFAFIAFTLWLGFRIVAYFLNRKQPGKWFGGSMVGLGLVGIIPWFLFVEADERMDYIHVPIIALIIAGLGGLMIWKMKLPKN